MLLTRTTCKPLYSLRTQTLHKTQWGPSYNPTQPSFQKFHCPLRTIIYTSSIWHSVSAPPPPTHTTFSNSYTLAHYNTPLASSQSKLSNTPFITTTHNHSPTLRTLIHQRLTLSSNTPLLTTPPYSSQNFFLFHHLQKPQLTKHLALEKLNYFRSTPLKTPQNLNLKNKKYLNSFKSPTKIILKITNTNPLLNFLNHRTSDSEKTLNLCISNLISKNLINWRSYSSLTIIFLFTKFSPNKFSRVLVGKSICSPCPSLFCEHYNSVKNTFSCP